MTKSNKRARDWAISSQNFLWENFLSLEAQNRNFDVQSFHCSIISRRLKHYLNSISLIMPLYVCFPFSFLSHFLDSSLFHFSQQGDYGASELSDVIAENKSLISLHIDNNNFTLVLYFPLSGHCVYNVLIANNELFCFCCDFILDRISSNSQRDEIQYNVVSHALSYRRFWTVSVSHHFMCVIIWWPFWT
jgi:hypothetical protein